MRKSLKQKFLNEKIKNNLPQIINTQRQNHEFCDFTLKTHDGGSFPVHKNILAAASTFFKEKFNNMKLEDCASDSVEFINVSSGVLESVIEYMYVGDIELSSKTAKETLDIALILGLIELADGCTEFLIKIINAKNSFDLLTYSTKHNWCKHLTKECSKYILDKVDINEIQIQSFETIKLLLDFKPKDVNQEKICSIVVDWISHDMDGREQFIQTLLHYVRFENLSYEFCLTKIFNNATLMKNYHFLLKLADTQKKKAELKVQQGCGTKPILNVDDDKSELEDTSNSEENINNCLIQKRIFSVVGCEMISFDSERKEFNEVVTIVDNRYFFGYTTFGDNNFFLCGGVGYLKEDLNTCQYFSIHTSSWKELNPMRYPRYEHRAITLNDNIYACGGRDNRTVDIFDLNKLFWSDGPPLAKNMHNFGLCTLNGCVYAVDGSNFQRYDPREKYWTHVLQSSNIFDDRGCVAIGLGDSIYGIDQIGIRKFDLRNKKWLGKQRKQKKELKMLPHVCNDNEKISSLVWNGNNQYLFQSYCVSGVLKCENSSINCSQNDTVQALFTI